MAPIDICGPASVISTIPASSPMEAQDASATAGETPMEKIKVMKTKIRIKPNIRLERLRCQSTIQ